MRTSAVSCTAIFTLIVMWATCSLAQTPCKCDGSEYTLSNVHGAQEWTLKENNETGTLPCTSGRDGPSSEK